MWGEEGGEEGGEGEGEEGGEGEGEGVGVGKQEEKEDEWVGRMNGGGGYMSIKHMCEYVGVWVTIEVVSYSRG